MLELIIIFAIGFTFLYYIAHDAEITEFVRTPVIEKLNLSASRGNKLSLFLFKVYECPLCFSFWILLFLYLVCLIPWYVPVTTPICVKFFYRWL